MDKPLSQERLKPKELEEIERQAYMNSISGRPELRYPIGPEVVKLVNEVKRLQAIEQHAIKRLKAETRGNSELAAERDRYKAALEEIQWYPQGNALVHVQAIKQIAKNSIEGVNDHE